ncbi:MAG: AAA family ATPase, partial [Patescibacteria group bacterium]
MDDIVSKFSNHLKNVLTRALCLVVDSNCEAITPKHLLWALGTQQGCVASEILHKSGVRLDDLTALVPELCKKSMGELPNKSSVPALSEESKNIIEKAVLTANLHEHRYVGTEHLLSGILQTRSPDIDNFFEKLNINPQKLNQNITTVFQTTASFPDFPESNSPIGAILSELDPATLVDFDLRENDDTESATPALDYFTDELTDKEINKQIDPVIGRKDEIERLMKILTRRTKNNPILVGEPGVGKTAIVEGLAKKIVEGTVPDTLLDKKIYRLDLASLIAGTMYRGEFESRLRQLIEEVTERPETILFIDEVHSIMGAGSASGSLDAANILKP